MSLNPDCEKKVLAMGSGEAINRGFLDIFKAVAVEIGDLPSGTLVVPFYDEHSGIKTGDFVAELHFVVRRVDTP